MLTEQNAGCFRVLVCVSGGGTNLQAILDAKAAGRLENAEIVRVISNKAGAFALERASKAGIEGVCVSPKDFPDRAAFHSAFLAAVDEAKPDLPLQKSDHQHPPVSDPVLLRHRLLWTEGT